MSSNQATKKVTDVSSATSRTKTSLRKKVLKKITNVTSASTSATPLPSTPIDNPPQKELTNVAETAEAHIITDSEPPMSDQEDMESLSVCSASSVASRRTSLLYTTPKRTGVQIDMVTGVANDLLQRGKEALESAGTMKREAKITAYESLQGLYETVLSLSDSRNRHTRTSAG
ncbi:unnamed protein product [Euphydryas editha]|uniref:Uncharacterized protein n=1 Tax=Euphydryas editha TaxID=104508 RepID=A0AAU9TN98_EUPED|nr:unnamed protein product [Euphydryas editha]